VDQLAFFREAFDSAPIGMLVADGAGVMVYVNRQLEQLFGYGRAELLGQPVELLIDGAAQKHRAHREQFAANPSARPMGGGRDLFGRHRLGHKVPVEVGLTPLLSLGSTYLMASVSDLTERFRARDELQASVAEKEVLLMEVHHRAKNNLQLIASLIDLASANPGPNVLDECRDRITSIALVHEQLYQSDSLSSIELRPYLNRLSEQVTRNWSHASPAEVDVRLEIADITLTMSDAVPCGLVVNELLTNAFKHAFPAERGGTILVQATRAENRVALKVEDDGVGLPREALHPAGHIGLELVRSLARQLKGQLLFDEGPGTRITLVFEGARG
jgi:PAS domain S-box-containing protein